MAGGCGDLGRRVLRRGAWLGSPAPHRPLRRVGKGALAPCPPSSIPLVMVGTRSLSSGAHSRDPVALPTLRLLHSKRSRLNQPPLAQHDFNLAKNPRQPLGPRLLAGGI